MKTSYTDLEAGNRTDITVEVVEQQRLDCAGGRVCRLQVVDTTGTVFTVLTTAERDHPDVEAGATYRLLGVLGAAPVSRSVDDDWACPDCGGDLRQGGVVDIVDAALAQAVSQLDLDGLFGIVDAEASVRRVATGETAVDDWTPMQSDRSVTTPEYVCDACGRHVDSRDLHGAREAMANEADMEMAEGPGAVACSAPAETVGLAAGGAKDVDNFRENVASGYTPQPEAISDEGLFYDYYFETGQCTETDALFAPRYAAAVAEHPIEGPTERYLSVGLDSTLSVDAFERPRLDLVAVLDVSGSMDSDFDAYYYDEHGNKQTPGDGAATKLEAATQSLCALTEQLREDDRLGVVLYNHRAHVAKPLRDVATTDMPAIRRHIRDIAAGGSTNLADGFEAAVDMLVDETPDPRTERRVVFMTDMMPNTGTTEEGELTSLFADAAAEGIHTTFIGMGLDANADLSETLSGIRGANHYFIHSAEEFERRLGEEFDYMVTPLVYDLTLELDADGYEVDAVHGSPSADPATDRLMHVGTLFPSAKQDGDARGGVVLARLLETGASGDLELVASWTERDGGQHRESVTVALPDEPDTYAHDGVRKAIALARYARELRTWARDLHDRADAATGVDDWLLPDQRGQHERESVPLVVPEAYHERFATLRSYLADEMDALGDEALQQELDLLATLCEEAPKKRTEVSE
jgi:Ca-activated chloride channel family protein